jgi:2,5-diamino-6-(ribosylamino)-4(3H)-pyrimidinone 5'-phosphate reductase
MNRPETTLFMLTSVDGKISTGDADILDVDKDFPQIVGVKEGLQQYYNLEQQTDFFSLNSGRVQAKIGVNEKTGEVNNIPVNFIIIDNQPHLKLSGIDYFLKRGKKLFLVTTNKNHPAFERKSSETLEIIFYENKINFTDLLSKLKKDFECDRLTIQTGGTLNAILLREGLIDHISIVVAPVLIGGKDTATLIDGESLHAPEELSKIKALKLVKCDVLENSYLHLQYDVMN